MKNFPGTNLGDIGQNVSQFSEQRVDFGGGGVGTHQTDVIQSPTVDSDDAQFNNASAALDEILGRVSNPQLIALRSQHPFVDIVPLPAKNLLVVAAINNDVREVQLPGNCQMVRFSANTVDFYVSFQGNVQMPPVEEVTNGNGSMYAPTHQWYYVKGLRSLSIGLALANTAVSIQCYVQL